MVVMPEFETLEGGPGRRGESCDDALQLAHE